MGWRSLAFCIVLPYECLLLLAWLWEGTRLGVAVLGHQIYRHSQLAGFRRIEDPLQLTKVFKYDSLSSV